MMKLTCTCIGLSACVAALLAGCGGDVNMLAPATDAAVDPADSSTAPDTIADSLNDTPDIDTTPDASIDAPADVDIDVEQEEASAETGLLDSPGDVCGPGQDWCGVCIDIVTNPENCGWCGHECAVGASCSGGHCECPAGTEECAGVCMDPKTDVQHCGECGHECPVGAACQGGTCECPSGMDPCTGVCVDESSDVSHCGACGSVCAVGAACESGQCECPAGQTVCSGVCVNLQTDGSNCGTCGDVCITGEECGAGTCVCLPDWTECGGTCVNLQTDGQNCGACGHDCQGGACDAGWCGPVVLSANTGPRRALAVDEEYAYWVEQSTSWVWRQPLVGGPQELIADWSSWPTNTTPYVNDLWIDGDFLYFSSYHGSAGGLGRVAKAGGTAEQLLNAPGYWSDAAYDGGEFVWATTNGSTSNSTIFRAALPSMTPATVASGQSDVRWVAVGNGYAYWATKCGGPVGAGQIVRAPTQGGEVEVIAGNQSYPDNVAVDDLYVYWVDKDGLHRHEFPPYGWIESPPHGENIWSYTVSDGFLYGATVGTGQIWQLRPSVWPVAMELRATGQVQPMGLVTNDTCVFWMGMSDYSVMKMVK